MIKAKDLFAKYIKYFQILKNKTEKELRKLPKGVVQKKRIKKWYYYYLYYRKGSKVFSDYIGKKKPVRLLQQVKRRQCLTQKLYEVENNLYALGAARRITRGLSLRRRFEIFKRDDFTCQYCGRNVKKHKVVLAVDHIFPKRKGGEDRLSNFITSCSDCNLGKHDNLLKL